MRLSEIERRALSSAIQGLPYEVFLFGSRCEDFRKGGDVDILILAREVTNAERLNLALKVASRFQSVCDEKIDVVVLDITRLTPAEEAFLTLIGPKKLPLAA